MNKIVSQAQPLAASSLTIFPANEPMPSQSTNTDSRTSSAYSAFSAPQTPENWPHPLAEDAFYGLAGDIVRTIEPHTEADPAALMIQLLTTFGNVVGREAHFMVEATPHHPNLFAVVVGDTAKSRKGTSWGPHTQLL